MGIMYLRRETERGRERERWSYTCARARPRRESAADRFFERRERTRIAKDWDVGCAGDTRDTLAARMIHAQRENAGIV